jgi:hypothetical protein
VSRGALVRLSLLAVAVAAATTTGVVSVRQAGEQLAVLDACAGVERGDWPFVLAQTAARVGPDETGRAAVECRCTALLATGRGDECTELLEQVLARPEAEDWAPRPELSVHLVQTLRDAGRAEEAAAFARRAGRAHPEDPDIFYLELVTRASVEDEERMLEELAARVARRGEAAARMRVSLANRHLLRGDSVRALEALGYTPPRGAGDALGPWFETRGMALASADDVEGLRRTYQRWRDAGGDPAEIDARYALTLSIAKLRDPEQPTRELLRRALEHDLSDPALEEALTIRLVLSLVLDERIDEALAVYDRGRERFALAGLTRDEIQRAAAHRLLAGAPAEARRGEIAFRLEGAAPGSQLLVSPQPDAPVDTDYQPIRVPPSGELTLARSAGEAPQRWVLRDARGATLASGSTSPVPGRSVAVAVAPGTPRPPQTATLTRRGGDGRRRVTLVLLDCADWRIVQYLRARGELPVLSRLIETGFRAVLESDPPLTAAALEALVWPHRSGQHTFVGLVHQFGVELAGLASIGDNPFSALAWLLPETSDLFSVVGEGERSAANMLFSHGGVRSGRHGIVTGPGGQRRRIPIATGARDFDRAERVRFPELAAVTRERDAVHLRTIAAEFDAAEILVRRREIDLLALRIEPLDILTHAHFAEAVADGQDDGRGLLFSLYRYIDDRLGAVSDLLDEDDVFVVMSDHGIRTAMEHSREALFVAVGARVPVGRAPGRPHLRGVSRVVADLLGVATTWPDTGVAAWAGDLAAPEVARPAAALAAPEVARPAATPHPAPAVR